MAAPGPGHLVVVPHTHWDREWYRSHESFRYRLVRVLDGLLDLLERDPSFRRFTLDGQMIALDDYLEVRPQARERIAKLVREGRLLVGPWYVLPDEWLVSGEALIRNLRLGLSRAADFGGGMRLGYVPDQFGHVGQLPQIFAGLGFEAAVLWRGVGADVDQTCFTWEAPDGTRLFSVYLVQGYGNASDLPLDPEALAERLRGVCAGLEPHSRIPTLLLMNGGDHAAPQPGLPRALADACSRLDGATCEIGALPDFVSRARAEAPDDLPLHRGELRSGLRAPLLEGCASARVYLKQADFRNDRLLVRWLEPLAAWLGALGGDPDPGILDLAWRIALENHPHDSICGCSIDPVHEAMETRFARVEDLAREHLRRVTGELGRRVRPVAGPGRSLEDLVVWNPGAGGVAQAEGVLQLDVRDGRLPALHLRDRDGQRIPVHAEIAEPGALAARYQLPARVVDVLARGFPAEFSGEFVRHLSFQERAGRRVVEVGLGSEPRPDFDLEAARDRVSRRLSADPEAIVEFRARRLPRVRLRFVDALPGQGLRVYRLCPGRAEGGALRSGRDGEGGAWIENEHWRVQVAPDGSVRCLQRATGTVIEDALRLVSEGDRGDEYNFDPVPDAPVVARPERARVRLGQGGTAEVGLRIDARYRVPASLSPDRRSRSGRRALLPARLELRLAAGLDRVDVRVHVDNAARDHRLRLLLRAPFRAGRLQVESAFELAERPIEPAPDTFGSDRPAEQPIGATPQRAFASVSDGTRAFTVANRGMPEVEALREPDGSTCLALTVLRAVGWLSRDDLALRPMHAGPGLETPGAQVPGPASAEVSFRLHPAADPRRLAEAHAFAWPALVFAGAGDRDAPLRDGARLLEVDDPQVAVSAIEPRPGGDPIVRLYHAGTRPCRPRVRWNAPGATVLEPVDLMGRPAPLAGSEADGAAGLRLSLRPGQIVSLRPR
jgi:alpha-mannosidase